VHADGENDPQLGELLTYPLPSCYRSITMA